MLINFTTGSCLYFVQQIFTTRSDKLSNTEKKPNLFKASIHSVLRKNLANIKKHGKDHHSIKVGTLGDHYPLRLKSYKIRYPI